MFLTEENEGDLLLSLSVITEHKDIECNSRGNYLKKFMQLFAIDCVSSSQIQYIFRSPHCPSAENCDFSKDLIKTD